MSAVTFARSWADTGRIDRAPGSGRAWRADRPGRAYHQGMPRYARTEREALAYLMLELGPDAPTVNEGWTTRDLAAHQLVRERRPDAAGARRWSAIRPTTPASASAPSPASA